MTQKFPYKAWTLMPSFKPVEVEFVKEYGSWNGVDYGDITAKGKRIDRSNIFPDKAAALVGGWERITTQEADQRKRQDAIDKRKAALVKAAG